jgi:dUTP pyrophosphatase
MTEGAAGFDLYAAEPVDVPAGETVLIPLGIAVAIPVGYEMQIRPRSGMSFKTKIRVANAPGTIDSDFRGEIKVIVDNIGGEFFRVFKGERIAQGVIAAVERAEFEIVDDLDDTERGQGGFGHTGTN